MARTHGHGNPKWTRDEVILALDLYFKCAGNIPSRDDARVRELSSLLRRLPYHEAESRKDSFRNPDGVAFKLQNLRQVATGKGLGNVSETDRLVWAEFGGQRDKVKQLGDLIRTGIKLSESMQGADEDDDDEEFFEGRVITRLHKKRERNRKVRKRLLASRSKNGRLTCDMCGGHSRATDPGLEDATFEAHHRLPVSVAKERITRLLDLALLCANCHRLLHRAISSTKRWVDIDEGRTLLGMSDDPGKDDR